MSSPEPIVVSAEEVLQQGDWVRILATDVYHHRVGQIHWVYPHARADEYKYLVRFSSLYGADLIPYQQSEVSFWQEREEQPL